jgi:hypothetical protein
MFVPFFLLFWDLYLVGFAAAKVTSTEKQHTLRRWRSAGVNGVQLFGLGTPVIQLHLLFPAKPSLHPSSRVH